MTYVVGLYNDPDYKIIEHGGISWFIVRLF